ncbi:hypothetical protein [Oryza sativa Japonica Group]|uniref:Uncharacterized protein P0501G01.31 n=1 Tax=Oryza sativa subsp. japonica TaxID=39947 RepID=Q5ZE60_ORYSJ|nr:hypothetical protein [Oryza sativa Japonica Group]
MTISLEQDPLAGRRRLPDPRRRRHRSAPPSPIRASAADPRGVASPTTRAAPSLQPRRRQPRAALPPTIRVAASTDLRRRPRMDEDGFDDLSAWASQPSASGPATASSAGVGFDLNS